MRNKIQNVISFYRLCNWKGKVNILYTLIELPACLFHELCHILAGLILTFNVPTFEVEHFYEVQGRTLRSYRFSVGTKRTNKLFFFFIASAPIYGYMSLFFILGPWFIPYGLLCARGFWLSKEDKMNVRYCLGLSEDEYK